MKIISDMRSPNFSDLVIPVQLAVLHYTAATLEQTLALFMSEKSEVSAHMVIDQDGTVYEMVECLGGRAKRAWHAGKSRLESSEVAGRAAKEGCNDFSIGIELVNFNGNVFSYTEAQYASLFAVIEMLKGVYPALSSPESIVGHEHISSFRGKIDPGICFEWQRLFESCYPHQKVPSRPSAVSPQLGNQLRIFLEAMGFREKQGEISFPEGVSEDFFCHLSSLLEAMRGQ